MTDSNQASSTFSKENWPGLFLGLFTLLSIGLIALGQIATKEAIAERLAEDIQRNLSQIIPASYHDNNLLDAPVLLTISDKEILAYQGKLAGQLNAVAFSVTSTDGYGGPILIMLGIDLDGHILGVRVLSHSETPGLGDKIEILKSDWIKKFEGKGLDNLERSQWAVKKDGGQFDAFSGATITPRAIVKAVYQGLVEFDKQRSKLIASQGADNRETKK